MTAKNCLLAVLPREIYEKLAPSLKLVSLEQGKILHHPGETIKDIYFPLDCLFSITMTMKGTYDPTTMVADATMTTSGADSGNIVQAVQLKGRRLGACRASQNTLR